MTGALGAATLAGCLGGGSGDGTDTESMGDDGTNTEGMAGGTNTDGMDGGTTVDGSMDGTDSMGTDSMGTDSMGTDSMETDSMETDSMGTDAAGWLGRELTDVTTGETFTIAGLDGPVVLQSFAVWCPKCQSQSENLSELRERRDDVTVVSLNTDPNENADRVTSHAADNGFGWRFAVSPAELTQALIEEFGAVVTNAPSTPVIVVCPDGSASLIDQRSVTSAATIADNIDRC